MKFATALSGILLSCSLALCIEIVPAPFCICGTTYKLRLVNPDLLCGMKRAFQERVFEPFTSCTACNKPFMPCNTCNKPMYNTDCHTCKSNPCSCCKCC